MPKRCRLTARAQIDGEVREPGYIFMLEDGVRGPHRASGTNLPEARDVPLYEECPEEALAEEAAPVDPNVKPADGAGDVKTPVFVSENDPADSQPGDAGVQTPVVVSENDPASKPQQ